MIPHELLIAIRNVMLISLTALLIVPTHGLVIQQELLRIWRSINERFLVKKQAAQGKNKFWEIDMTKFEP